MSYMSVSYTLRIPEDLKRLMAHQANVQGSTLPTAIIKACWQYLDGGSSKRPEPESLVERKAQKDISYGSDDASAASVMAMGDSQTRPTMQALRDICGGKTPQHILDAETDKVCSGALAQGKGASSLDSTEHWAGNPKVADWNMPPAPLQEIPICGKDWWEDGEQYECLMDKGHREQKHGMRGMVRKLEN